MRTYDKNLYFGFMEKSIKKINGKIGRIHNGKYFSVFLKLNDKDFFDLSDDNLYNVDDIFIIGKLNTENKECNEKEISKDPGSCAGIIYDPGHGLRCQQQPEKRR